MSLKQDLELGVKVVYCTEVWTITGVNGSRYELQRAGRTTLKLPEEILTSPGFRFVDVTGDALGALLPLFRDLTPDELAEALDLEGHVLEVLTGDRSGDPALAARERDPRYLPSVPKMDRYRSKADELGIGLSTMRRLCSTYDDIGLEALIDERRHREKSPLGGVDAVWLQALREVLHENINEPQLPTIVILDRARDLAKAKVKEADGESLRIPSESTGRRIHALLTKNCSATPGKPAKAKRSNAERPAPPFGRLRPDRIGEVVVLDTSPLDCFAMERLTLRWVQTQLTISMNWNTRSITGVRLSTISYKAVDVALVLRETISPLSRSHAGPAPLPYAGIPETVLYHPMFGSLGLPGIAVDTVIMDHGKPYMAAHVRAVCQRFGISIQPARVRKPTDKPILERWFGTLGKDLLARLTGYKGPDIHSRGPNAEDTAFYFVDELEDIIRDWVCNRYHQRRHAGLRSPFVPGVKMTPTEAWEEAMSRFGYLSVPARADLAYDFLPEILVKTHHYGVQCHVGHHYDGPGLDGYRNGETVSIRFDPHDATRVYFQRPDDRTWHTLRWKLWREVRAPFSVEALQYARRYARTQLGPKATKEAEAAAMDELLARWDVGKLENREERRIALRLCDERAALMAPQSADDGESDDDDVEADDGLAIASSHPASPQDAPPNVVPKLKNAQVAEHVSAPVERPRLFAIGS